MNLPSASNTAGSFVGTIVGGAIAAAGPTWPFVVTASAALGMTPLALAGILAVIATGALNYGVTHIAQLHDLDERLAVWWPQITPTYPTGTNGKEETTQPAQTNITPKG